MNTGLSYELAKQLKDSGFPQEMIHRGRYVWIPEKKLQFDKENEEIKKNGGPGAGINKEVFDQFVVADPNLEELIEACGDIEFRIHCYPKESGSDIKNGPWFVVERINWSDMPRCSNPLVAVANLYIALQNKT